MSSSDADIPLAADGDSVKGAGWSIAKLRDCHALWISAIALISIHLCVAFLSSRWEFFPGGWPLVWSELFRWAVVPFVALLGLCRLGRNELAVLSLVIGFSPLPFSENVMWPSPARLLEASSSLAVVFAGSWVVAPLLGVTVVRKEDPIARSATFQRRLVLVALSTFGVVLTYQALLRLGVVTAIESAFDLSVMMLWRGVVLAAVVAVSVNRLPLFVRVGTIATLLISTEAAFSLLWSVDLLALGLQEWLAEAISLERDIWPYMLTDLGILALGLYVIMGIAGAAGYRILVSDRWRTSSGPVGVGSLAMLALMVASLLSLREEPPVEQLTFPIGNYTGQIVIDKEMYQIDFTALGVVMCTGVEAIPLRERDFTTFTTDLDLQGKVRLSDLNHMGKITQILLRELRSSHPDVQWRSVVLNSYNVTELDREVEKWIQEREKAG